MTKRTSTLLTSCVAALLFFVGLGIATYQGKEDVRRNPVVLTDFESGTAGDTSYHASPIALPEDDGCFPDRGEASGEMDQKAMDALPADHPGGPLTSEASQEGDPVLSDSSQEGDPASSGTAGQGTVVWPKTPHGGGGVVEENSCPRPRPSTDSDCPEL